MFLRKTLLPTIGTIDDVFSLVYHQLSIMLAAGIPLNEALDTLLEESDNRRVRQVLTAFKQDIGKDMTPDRRFATYPKFYSEALIYALKKSEFHNKTSKHLAAIADEFEGSGDIKRRISSAFHYPVILISMTLIVLTVILIFVVPVFEEMFAGFGHDLPEQTQLIVDISNFLRQNQVSVLVIFAITVLLIVKFKKQLAVPATYIPFVGKVFGKISMMQFTKYLSIMFAVNAPIRDALQYSAVSIDNPVFSKKIKQIGDTVSNIDELKHVIKKDPLFPRIVSQVIASGEKAQTLDYILLEVSRYCKKDVDQFLHKLINIVDLLVFIITGASIGWIVIAMYQPVFSMAGALGG